MKTERCERLWNRHWAASDANDLGGGAPDFTREDAVLEYPQSGRAHPRAAARFSRLAPRSRTGKRFTVRRIESARATSGSLNLS